MKFKAIDARRRSTTIALGAALVTPTSVWAQDIPSNAPALKILVGYPAGGGGDALVRTVSKKLGQVLQRSIVVDNKPGAGGTLAASLLANSPADGATVYMADSAILVATATQEKLGYDPQSLTPILGTGQLAYCVVVHPSFPARSVEELIQVLRASPGKYSYGSPGVGNIAHLAAEKFKKAAGVDMLHVPYKGGAPALIDLIGGQIPICFISLPPALAQRSTGKLRVLGVTTLQRWETAKDIPSISETLPGFEAVTSMFIVAPPRTPGAAVERLALGFRTVLSDPEIKRTFLEMGANVEFLGPDALGKQISAELKSWPELARSIGIRPGSS